MCALLAGRLWSQTRAQRLRGCWRRGGGWAAWLQVGRGCLAPLHTLGLLRLLRQGVGTYPDRCWALASRLR